MFFRECQQETKKKKKQSIFLSALKKIVKKFMI